MKKILFSLVLVTILLLVFVNIQKKDVIVVYTSMEQHRNDALQEQLDEIFPQYNVVVKYVSTGKVAAKINVEKQSTEADIVVGLDTAFMKKILTSVADIPQAPDVEYLDGLTLADNSNQFITWERDAGSFIINEDVLNEHNLPIPTTYDDLLNPQYKNLIAMPNPKTSGTGYFFYKALVNDRGEEEALAYFDKLNENIKLFTESGSAPLKLLIQGEIGIAMGLTFVAVTEMNKGFPFKIIFPETGSPYFFTGTAIVKGRETNEKILQVFDYIVNDFFKYDKEHFVPEAIYENQINRIENYPSNVVYADMTGIDSLEEKERLLSLWKY